MDLYNKNCEVEKVVKAVGDTNLCRKMEVVLEETGFTEKDKIWVRSKTSLLRIGLAGVLTVPNPKFWILP